MEKNFKKHFTSSAVIIKDNKILLIWHKKLNTWLYPGGHIEENESPDDAVIREVKEETSLNVKIIEKNKMVYNDKIAKVLHMPYVIFEEQVGNKEENHFHIDMVYICTPINNEVKIQKSEIDKYKWFSIDEIKDIKMYDNLKFLLLKILKNKELSQV